jgi:Uma2 family endonuclease
LGMATETVVKKLFTVDEYHRMGDAGILPEDKRFELIRGEIIEMPQALPPHSGRVNRLTSLFTSRLGGSIVLSVQNPSSIDDMSEPVPDVTLLKPRADFYTESHPGPSDVLLMIEVSNTSVRFDTKVKAPLYAEAGIREYWILNIPKNVLEVRSEPVNGVYTRHEILKHGQTVSPRAFPEISFKVEEILG